MCDKSLCKVHVETGDLYMLCTAWEEGNAGFDIILTDTRKAWTGQVSEDELGDMSKKMKVSFESFISETRKALSRQNVGNLNFEYGLKRKNNDYIFTWKKYLPTEKIRIQLGQTEVTPVEEISDVVKDILQHSTEAAEKAQDTITSLRSDNERLSAERAGALKRLERAVTSKEEMETDLYSKFVLVVNDKKRKIRELRDDLEKSESATPSTSAGSKDNSREQKKKTRPAEEDLDEESENEVDGHGSDYNTDEEKELQSTSAPSPSKKQKTKVKEETLDTSDNLLLDINDSDTSPVTTTTRRRGRKGAVKQTPSKPIIPKVSSSEQKAKSTRGRPSMKKSDSHTSNQSSTSRKSSDPSPDDLLADL